MKKSTGLSDFHKMIIAVLKCWFIKLKAKETCCRIYKKLSLTMLLLKKQGSTLYDLDTKECNYKKVWTEKEVCRKQKPAKYE